MSFVQTMGSCALTIISVGLVMIASTASARPWFIVIDVDDPKNTPAKYGYLITATQNGDKIDFKIVLNTNASNTIQKANIFFHTLVDPKPNIRVKIQEKDGLKTIKFSIAQKLLPYCMLHIDSGPIIKMEEGHPNYLESYPNFAGYRLRMDNVKIKKAEPSFR